MFRFENPDAFYLFVIIPVMIGLWYSGTILLKKRRETFGSDKLLRRLISGPISTYKSILVWATLFTLLILALSNPQAGLKKEKVKVENIDIFIALDISASMNATDISPSRLEKSKRFIEQLIESRQGDQIGLILFAGSAYLQMPLTTDYAAAMLFTRAATTDMAGNQGTVIGEAIDLAMLSVKEKNQRALIIISDGEDHDDNANDMATKAADSGWSIFTVGAGTAEGSFIPVVNDGREEYKTDEEGNPVKSVVNKKLLEDIAESGRGVSYFLENDNNDIIKDINAQLSKIQKRAVEVKSFTEYRSFYQYFLAAALLIIIFQFLRSAGFIANKKGTSS
jgi:Ca-activated chloride channel family protein